MNLNRSVIQSTMIKITVIVFCILIMLYFYIAKIYWDKEALKKEFELLSIASAVEKQVQADYSDIKYYEDMEGLDGSAKVEKISSLLQQVFNDFSKEFPGTEIGYYDKALDAVVAVAPYGSPSAPQVVSHSKISSSLLESGNPEYLIDSGVVDWNGEGTIAVTVPVYYQNTIVGHTWAKIKSDNIYYLSSFEYTKVLVPSILLWILVLILIRRNIVQIQTSLDSFTRMIITNSQDSKEDLEKLPELKPVFEKIKSHLDNLRELNTELENSNEKLTTIMEGISDGFFSLDREWRFTFVNEEIRKRLKKENDDLLGENIWEVFPSLVDSISYENLNAALNENVSKHWEEYSVQHNKYFQYHAYPFNQGLTVFERDITERKLRDKEMQRLERLNLIGQMAAGISHEVRNPLATVRGFLQILEDRADPTNMVYMDLMISEIDRANVIITDFLSLAKVNSDSMKEESINEIIKRLFPMLQADALNSSKDLVLELNDVPNSNLNESEMRQLILNLVRNGLEETPEGGKIIISTYLQENSVVLAIKDHGKGIPANIQESIGTPFFTTKENGTGLGLAISMGIAQRHNAKFEFETGEQGTTFFIIFPLEN